MSGTESLTVVNNNDELRAEVERLKVANNTLKSEKYQLVIDLCAERNHSNDVKTANMVLKTENMVIKNGFECAMHLVADSRRETNYDKDLLREYDLWVKRYLEIKGVNDTKDNIKVEVKTEEVKVEVKTEAMACDETDSDTQTSGIRVF